MHPKQSERSQRSSTQFKNKLHGTHKEYWYPIPIHFCQHLLNLDCDGYEFCHQTEKVVCNTCTVRMQGCRGCRLHGAVPYAKCWISLATTVHRCTHVQSLTHAQMTKTIIAVIHTAAKFSFLFSVDVVIMESYQQSITPRLCTCLFYCSVGTLVTSKRIAFSV